MDRKVREAGLEAERFAQAPAHVVELRRVDGDDAAAALADEELLPAPNAALLIYVPRCNLWIIPFCFLLPSSV